MFSSTRRPGKRRFRIPHPACPQGFTQQVWRPVPPGPQGRDTAPRPRACSELLAGLLALLARLAPPWAQSEWERSRVTPLCTQLQRSLHTRLPSVVQKVLPGRPDPTVPASLVLSCLAAHPPPNPVPPGPAPTPPCDRDRPCLAQSGCCVSACGNVNLSISGKPPTYIFLISN